jgi:hypothetical protein
MNSYLTRKECKFTYNWMGIDETYRTYVLKFWFENLNSWYYI